METLTRYDAMRTALVESHQSRADAKYFRDTIRERNKGCCEVCGFFCHPIMHVHHVKPVSKGGDGYPSNLIALCPNCHATIHKMKDTERTGDEKGLALIGSWVEIMYRPDQMRLLEIVAFEKAEYVAGAWVEKEAI